MLQDASGDGMGGGVLAEPLFLRGKSAWTKQFLDDWWGYYAEGFAGSEREALQQLLSSMHEEERARRVRILEMDAVFTTAPSAEPVAWHAQYKPPSLLVSFDALGATSRGAAAEARGGERGNGGGGSLVCPAHSSDRQMLRCLHAFTALHLKAIQSADARYTAPLVFDVLSSPSSVASTTVPDGVGSTSDDGGGAGRGGRGSSGGGTDTDGGNGSGGESGDAVDVTASSEGGGGSSSGGGGGGGSGGSGGSGGGGGRGGGGDGGSESDVAGGWLTPRLPSGRPNHGDRSGGGLTCPAVLPGARRSARPPPSQLPGAASDLADLLKKQQQQQEGDRGVGKPMKDQTRLEQAACASGSTWARMSRHALSRHVLAVGERLGLGEGMSVLDVGATCGHALAILQERYRHRLRAVGVDGSKVSMRYAKRTCRGTFCVGDARSLAGVPDDSFDVAFTMAAPAQLTSERDVCAVAREMGRVIRPGGRAMIVSVPKSDCAVTQDEDWGCPRCFWRLRGIDKGFWPHCLQRAASADSPGGAYRVELLSNTALFPFKPAAYCQREHYTVLIHKKQPASVFVYQVRATCAARRPLHGGGGGMKSSRATCAATHAATSAAISATCHYISATKRAAMRHGRVPACRCWWPCATAVCLYVAAGGRAPCATALLLARPPSCSTGAHTSLLWRAGATGEACHPHRGQHPAHWRVRQAEGARRAAPCAGVVFFFLGGGVGGCASRVYGARRAASHAPTALAHARVGALSDGDLDREQAPARRPARLRSRRCPELGARAHGAVGQGNAPAAHAHAVRLAALGRPGHALHEHEAKPDGLSRCGLRPTRGEGRERAQHRVLLCARLSVVARLLASRVGAQRRRQGRERPALICARDRGALGRRTEQAREVLLTEALQRISGPDRRVQELAWCARLVARRPYQCTSQRNCSRGCPHFTPATALPSPCFVSSMLFVGVLASAQATSVRETTCYTSLALSVASHRAVSTLTCISSRAFIGLPSILLQQCSHTHGMVYFTLLLLYPRLVEPGAIWLKLGITSVAPRGILKQFLVHAAAASLQLDRARALTRP